MPKVVSSQSIRRDGPGPAGEIEDGLRSTGPSMREYRLERSPSNTANTLLLFPFFGQAGLRSAVCRTTPSLQVVAVPVSHTKSAKRTPRGSQKHRPVTLGPRLHKYFVMKQRHGQRNPDLDLGGPGQRNTNTHPLRPNPPDEKQPHIPRCVIAQIR